MKGANKNIIFSFIYITLSAWLRATLFRKLGKRIKKTFKQKTGIYFNIYQPSFKSLSRLHFSVIYIKTRKLTLILTDGVFDFNLRCLLGQRQLLKSIKVFEVGDVFIRLHSVYDSKNKLHNPTTKPSISIEKYYSLCFIALDKLQSFKSLGKINLFKSSFSVAGHRVVLSLKSVTITSRSLNCAVVLDISKYSFRTRFQISKSNDSKSLEIRTLDLLDIISEAHYGKQLITMASCKMTFMETDTFIYSLSGICINTALTTKYLSPAPKEFRKINFDLIFKLSQEEFYLQKGSTFETDGIAACVEFKYNFKERDLLKISFVVLIEGTSFFKEFPFLSANLKRISCQFSF